MALLNVEGHTILDVLSKESVIFDFGANYGNFAHALIAHAGCRVFSAEPVPELYAGIARHPRLTLLPVAITGRNGNVSINVFPGRCASLYSALGQEGIDQVVEVEGVTFAEFRRRSGVERIDVIKFDIEGAEIEVLRAMSDAELLSADQITIEFHAFVYPETLPDVETAIARLAGLGFHVIRFSRVTTDVLFVNPRLGVGALQLLWLRTAVKYSRGIRRMLERYLNKSS